jgi:type IV secretory pathway component VirB8
VGIPIELCLKSNQLQSIRTKENVQCDIKFKLTENKLKPIENIQFKVKLYREKKPRHFSYTIEYPYPPTNSACGLILGIYKSIRDT